MLDDRADRLARHESPELRDRPDPVGWVVDADLRQDLAALLDEEDVDARVHVQEHLGEVAGPDRVVEPDGSDRRRVVGEDARREREIGDVVVELRLEGAFGVRHPVADLVDQLAVQQPREDRERRQHHDDRQRDERGQLGADGPQAMEHEPRPSVPEAPERWGSSFWGRGRQAPERPRLPCS